MIRHALLAIAASGLLAVGASAPADAHDSRRYGASYVNSGFRVGGLFFKLAYVNNYQRPDGFYLRVSKPLHTEVACSGFCYRDRRHAYHHRSCPAVVAHFERFRPGLFAATFGVPARDYGHYRDDRHHGRHDKHAKGYYDDEYDDEWSDRRRRSSRRYAVRRHY